MRSYLNSWDRVSYPFALNATSQQPLKHRSRTGTETVEIEIVNERLEIVSETQQLQ